MKKTVIKAVATKAFETQSVELKQAVVYTLQPMGQTFVLCLDGEPCNKQGHKAATVGEAFTYRNHALGLAALDYFSKCKKF